MTAFNPPSSIYFNGIEFNPSIIEQVDTGVTLAGNNTWTGTNDFTNGIRTGSVDTIDVPGVLELGQTRAEIVNIKGQITCTLTDTSVDKCYFKTGTGGQATLDTDTAIPLHIAPSTTVEPSAICSGVVIGNSTIPVSLVGSTVTSSSLKTDTINGNTLGVTPLSLGTSTPNISLGYYISAVNFAVTKVFGRLSIQGGAGSIEGSGTDLDIGSVTNNTNIGFVGSGTNIKGYFRTNFLDRFTSGVLQIGFLATTTSVSILKQLSLSNPLILGSIPTLNTELGFTVSSSATVSVTLNTDTNIVSQAVSAGVYMVTGTFTFPAVSGSTLFRMWINTTSASQTGAKGTMLVPVSNHTGGQIFTTSAIFSSATAPTFYLSVYVPSSISVSGSIEVVRIA